jgi:glucoside 3-dehydrogenase (cytochrome c) hitch-hiker subunit
MTTRTIARREAIGRLALGSLGVAAPVWLEALTARAIEHAEGWSTAHAAAAAAWKPKALTAHQAETVATIAELIIPQTETAGARAARVHEFIDEVLA